jgi:glycosyltransferase involved in cell wall biosynthesis
MKRILYVDTLTELVGGAEISLMILMKNLEPSRYIPYLLTSAEGNLLNAARQAGIPACTQEFPWLSRRRPWPYIASIWKLARLIQRERIALVHTNCERSPTYVRRACQFTRTPYVCHVRDSERAWFAHSRRESYNRSRQIIANSLATAQYCTNNGIPDNLIAVAYSPINIREIVQRPAEDRFLWRQNLGIHENEIVFATVGQIKPPKGQLNFIKASARISQEIQESRFLIIGDAHNQEQSQYLESIKTEVMKSGLGDKVLFVGHKQDITPILMAIDILVLASIHEAFGRVIVEGMAAGRAVIATKSGGPEEIISHGIDGLLIPPGDEQALSSCMLTLAVDQPLRRKLIENGRKKAWVFDTSRHVEQIQEIYSKILMSGGLSAG